MYSDVVTLSSGGSILRAWNLPDGKMIWETSIQTSTSSKSLLHVLVCISNLFNVWIIRYVFFLSPIQSDQSLFYVQSNSKVVKDNLVLVSAGQWIYAVSSIDGVISWGKEFTLHGYA